MKILFYNDGSLQAEKAVRFAAPLAAAFEADTAILGVPSKGAEEKRLRRTAKVLEEILQVHELHPELLIRMGKARSEILLQTKEVSYDLMVVGAVSQNPLGKALNPLWKSVGAYDLIHYALPHVMLVTGYRPALRRVLLCTNGAATLDEAAEFAGQLAQAVKASVDLFHVMPKLPGMYASLVQMDEHVGRLLRSKSLLGRTLLHQVEILQDLGVFGEFRLHHGQLLPELMKELHQGDYDLVVCGTSPAKERLRRVLMGDTTRQIVNQCGLPVLIVKTGERTVWGLVKSLLPWPFQRASKNSEASGTEAKKDG